MAKSAKEIEVIVEEPEIEVIIEGPETDVDSETDDETAEDTSVELAVPDGGIGDFAMSDEDFEVLEAEEAKKEFGEEGLAQFTAVAKKMAGHGRFGDDSVAHIQTGEMVVPLSLLESNPALKAQIFKSLRENGIEDPEQYVVGSNANSINPETGLMEFGFLKKVFKGVKKVVKAVVKVVKKIAPIVLPIVLSLIPGIGPILGAALGSGIGTLIKGGNIKDALKSALFAGATAGIGAAAFGGTGSISGNLSAAMPNAGQFAGNFTSSAGLAGSEIGPGAATFSPGLAGSEIGPGAASFSAPQVDSFNTLAGVSDGFGDTAGIGEAISTNPVAVKLTPAVTPPVQPINAGAFSKAVTPPPQVQVAPETSFLDNLSNKVGKVGDFMFRAGSTKEQVEEAQKLAGEKYLADRAVGGSRFGLPPTQAGFDKAVADAGPGMLATYGPSALLAGTALAAGTDFFTTPETEKPGLVARQEDGTVTTGVDLIEKDPSSFLVKDLGATRLNPATGTYENVLADYTVGSLTSGSPATSLYTVPTNYPLQQRQQQVAMSPNGYLNRSNPGGPFARPYVQVAAGGPIFPRRNGGIAPTEGVQGQDSVRAMLMPGEFVMTTDAVRGLGNGNLNNGIKNMYSVMRNLERRGRATA